MKKLYVDDIRACPEGWDLARNYDEAIRMLTETDYDETSLDHDIASYAPDGSERTGKDIVRFLVERKIDGDHVPPVNNVHSANPVGSERMRQDIEYYLENDDIIESLRNLKDVDE